MIYYLVAAVFIITVAIASGSMVIASHLKSVYKSEFFSTLIFFLAFYFTFGLYAFWGQMLMSSLLSHLISEELLIRIKDLMILIGLPFLVFASMMFVKFSREITSRKTSNTFILLYLLSNAILIAAIAFLVYKNESIPVLTLLKYYYLLLSLIYTGLNIYYFLIPGEKKSYLRYQDMVKLSMSLLLVVIFNNLILHLSEGHILLTLLFILTYFLYAILIPVFIKYKADLSRLILLNDERKSFDQFCELYGISARETEIIHEICLGLSNQQIADRLFISLQTVKDHTHRIYSKTECSSRVQLIRMVSDTQK